jgi:anti-anti-sigma regulatory factor
MEPVCSDAGAAGACIITLPPDLDLPAAIELQQALRQVIEGGGAATIDASAVQRVSTLGFQVLAAAKCEMNSGSGGMNFLNSSDYFLRSAASAGLSGPLGLTGALDE